MDGKQAAAVIVAYMNSGELDVPATVRQAASDFARACGELNARLITCDELLRSNQRSEALRQVQLEPDALQLYNALAVPCWTDWVSTAQQVGLPQPPGLHEAAARALHKAFTAEQAVKDLLVRHRLLAVTRAPLRERLQVMRLLAKAEPTNLGWTADLKAYELVRFDELRAELTHPDTAFDPDAIRAIQAELEGPWASPPPLDLVGAARESHKAQLLETGKARIEQLAPQLQKALTTGDTQLAERLAAQVRAAAKEAGIAATSPRLALLRQADEWLEEEKRQAARKKQFEQSVADLSHALEENIDPVYIRGMYEVVLGFHDFEVPEDVLARYDAWHRGRTVRTWAAAAGGLFAVLLGIVIYLVAFR